MQRAIELEASSDSASDFGNKESGIEDDSEDNDTEGGGEEEVEEEETVVEAAKVYNRESVVSPRIPATISAP